MQYTKYRQGATNREHLPFEQAEVDATPDPFTLLVELCTHEPIVQHCVRIVQSYCLCRGVTCILNDTPASKEFQREIVDTHYFRFCEAAIRSMFCCGFVPWRLRRLPTGDLVPEVVPLGLFHWSVEVNTDRRQQRHQQTGLTGNLDNDTNKHDLVDTKGKYDLDGENKPDDKNDKDENNKKSHKRHKRVPCIAYKRQRLALQRQAYPIDGGESKLLSYKIRFIRACMVREHEVEIYEYIQPNMANTRATVGSAPSPLANLVSDYHNIRQALLRQRYADAWNTQGKFLCTYAPPNANFTLNEGNPITNDWGAPQNRTGLVNDSNLPTDFEQNLYVRDHVTETVVASKDVPHKPVIFTMPKNTSIAPVQHLVSNQNVCELQRKLSVDICGIMGIPMEMVMDAKSSGATMGSASKSAENSRYELFIILHYSYTFHVSIKRFYILFDDLRAGCSSRTWSTCVTICACCCATCTTPPTASRRPVGSTLSYGL
jgi:hypothetical protein